MEMLQAQVLRVLIVLTFDYFFFCFIQNTNIYIIYNTFLITLGHINSGTSECCPGWHNGCYRRIFNIIYM